MRSKNKKLNAALMCFFVCEDVFLCAETATGKLFVF